MALAEVADRSEVRRIERDNHHEIVPLAAGSRNAPRRIQPACIAMQQKRNHHARIERRLAQPTPIAAHDRLEIQALPHQPNDKPRDVVLGHEVPHIRRQKQRLIDIPGAKVLAHSPSLNQTRWHLNSDYSDRLLGLAITIIGLPFAWAHLKLAGLALWPIGKDVVSVDDARRSAGMTRVGASLP